MAANARTRELAWRRSHIDTLAKLGGKWVALEGERLVACGDDAAEAAARAVRAGIEVPFVFFVEPRHDGDVIRMGI